MTRKTILDKEEFEKRVQERLVKYGFTEKPRKKWDDEDKRKYRNIRSLVYSEMRRELLDKRNKLWAIDITRGSINSVLNTLGLNMYSDGEVRCIQKGAPILKWFIEKYVFPQLEAKCGITGVKIKKNITPNAHNILDFTQADMNISRIKIEEEINK